MIILVILLVVTQFINCATIASTNAPKEAVPVVTTTSPFSNNVNDLQGATSTAFNLFETSSFFW